MMLLSNHGKQKDWFLDEYKSKIKISVDGTPLENVEQYTHIGRIISPNDQMCKEIEKDWPLPWKKY